ncbi:MAG: aminotransferase class I/II-fold pyridoxal phosphate-dependent enzyme [Treponema sp.]|jgi:DNA-binding transcriptional MocR family regulator|nr:aminotransferase class I/II-fold pyridoxal phosphate-dependent enzyme [Treponema sp.]
MKSYSAFSGEQLLKEKEALSAAFDAHKAKGLSLNMARGKPDSEQLKLVMPILDTINSSSDCNAAGGVDIRNYGELTGIIEAKKLFGEFLGAAPDEMIITGSSSLNLMYDSVSRAMLTGVLGSQRPWVKEEKVKFLCPVPGYDRHFAICQFLGIEMINIPTTAEGPDMDMVESLVSSDPLIKGMWCVPKYSNPAGITYSDNVIRRLAALKPLAPDFRIFCDNAYSMHEIYDDTPLLNPLTACKEAGNPDMIYLFSSTNKITFPGAGVAFIAASKENIAFITKQLAIQAIGWDKINMLRHVRFFKDIAGIRAIMQKHKEILRPKFDAVLNKMEAEFSGTGAGEWIKPGGGYFIAFFARHGCAKRIISLCKEAGVTMTEAGAPYPYGKDPDDSCIRIAPSFPSLEELNSAMEIFCVAVKLATVESLLKG